MSDANQPDKEKPTVNFKVTEIWNMECPFCEFVQDAPFNHKNPMEPMDVNCCDCDELFTLTYE